MWHFVGQKKGMCYLCGSKCLLHLEWKIILYIVIRKY